MAAFLPDRKQLPPNPPTPPEQRVFNTMGSHLQRTPSTQLRNGGRLQHRISGEYRSGTFGPTNGNAALPVPTGPHGHISNGQPRNMTGMAGAGAFDGPRSPPNTKSEQYQQKYHGAVVLLRWIKFRYFARALQVL